MDSGAVRKGVTQARYNEDVSQIVWVEILLISGVLGQVFHSWLTFGACLIGFFVFLSIPILNVLFAITLSIGWGLIGYFAGGYFLTQNAGLVIGGIAFLSGVGAHLGFIEWTRDVSDPADRNIGPKRKPHQPIESPSTNTQLAQTTFPIPEQFGRQPITKADANTLDLVEDRQVSNGNGRANKIVLYARSPAARFSS